MNEYAWPAVLRPTRLSFYLRHNTLRFASPITRVTQVMRREGARWMAEASFDPLAPHPRWRAGRAAGGAGRLGQHGVHRGLAARIPHRRSAQPGRCAETIYTDLEFPLTGDVLASLTTMPWNVPSKAWTGAPMADASLNRRMTIRLADAVALPQIGIVGLDGQSNSRPSGSTAYRSTRRRSYAAPRPCRLEPGSFGRKSPGPAALAPGITSLLEVTVTDCRQGDRADAALASSTRFIELDAAAWTNNTVRVMARNISPGATFDLAAATLSVAATKRRIPSRIPSRDSTPPWRRQSSDGRCCPPSNLC